MGTKKNRFFSYQSKSLKKLMPDAKVKSTHNRIIFEGEITPSSLSSSYYVKIDYKKNRRPIITVIEPKLIIPEGKSLPHVYPTKMDLCLYYPKNNEWSSEKIISQTILPWASEWLYHYEIWLVTGEWNGGGIHPTKNKKETV